MGNRPPSLDIVIPFLNETETAPALAAMLAELAQILLERFELRVQVLLVDDGSSDDGAAALAKHLVGAWRILRLSRNFGKEIAVLAGMDNCDGDYLMIMDADLQHSRDIAVQLVAELIADPDVDVVYARTTRLDASWRRSRLAGIFYKVINSSQRFEIPANAGDFRVMRRTVARALVTVRDKKRFNKGLYAWTGFRQKAVDYQPAARLGGSSKWSRLSLLSFSLDGFTSFSVIPLRIVTLFGLLAALAAVLYGIKILLEVVFYGVAVPGYPSLLVAVVLLGGCNLLLLGLIGEYIWVALSETKDRPIYIIRDIVSPADRQNP